MDYLEKLRLIVWEGHGRFDARVLDIQPRSPNGGNFRKSLLVTLCPFLGSFGWHNSLCIFKVRASRGTKLCSYFNFCFPLQHMRRPVLQNKRVGDLKMAFRTRNVFETFKERVPAAYSWHSPRTARSASFAHARLFSKLTRKRKLLAIVLARGLAKSRKVARSLGTRRK